MGGGSSAPASQTQTVTKDIPQWAQDAGQSNYNLAQSIASQPYPTYQGQLIAGFTPQQEQGMQQAGTAATAYQPDLAQAEQYTQQATHPWDTPTAQQYMSPYVQAALQPQVQALQNQMTQQQHATDAQATQAGAFGDSRHGVQSALNNFNGNQQLAGIEAQGMNTAYNTGLDAYQKQQGILGNAGSQMANIGAQQQGLGETGAQANFQAGTQQQQLTQQQLTESYNNFMNQVLWPTQGLNERIAALGNTPYTQVNYTSLPPSNASANNVAAFSQIAGLLKGATGGGSGGGNAPVSSGGFGG